MRFDPDDPSVMVEQLVVSECAANFAREGFEFAQVFRGRHGLGRIRKEGFAVGRAAAECALACQVLDAHEEFPRMTLTLGRKPPARGVAGRSTVAR